MTFGEMTFGEMTFGDLTFGETPFGEMTFGGTPDNLIARLASNLSNGSESEPTTYVWEKPLLVLHCY